MGALVNEDWEIIYGSLHSTAASHSCAICSIKSYTTLSTHRPTDRPLSPWQWCLYNCIQQNTSQRLPLVQSRNETKRGGNYGPCPHFKKNHTCTKHY